MGMVLAVSVTSPAVSTLSGQGWRQAGELGLALLLSAAVGLSRVAAQIVSGIGFLGAGLIFVRRDSVRGLTTAASIWVTAALAFPAVTHRLPISATAISALRVRCPDGRGLRGKRSVTELAAALSDLDYVDE
jgi:uncharacterized membrane protein YhiD involved in acid resistance